MYKSKQCDKIVPAILNAANEIVLREDRQNFDEYFTEIEKFVESNGNIHFCRILNKNTLK
mgnify:CR=1 FL=1